MKLAPCGCITDGESNIVVMCQTHSMLVYIAKTNPQSKASAS